MHSCEASVITARGSARAAGTWSLVSPWLCRRMGGPHEHGRCRRGSVSRMASRLLRRGLCCPAVPGAARGPAQGPFSVHRLSNAARLKKPLRSARRAQRPRQPPARCGTRLRGQVLSTDSLKDEAARIQKTSRRKAAPAPGALLAGGRAPQGEPRPPEGRPRGPELPPKTPRGAARAHGRGGGSPPPPGKRSADRPLPGERAHNFTTSAGCAAVPRGPGSARKSGNYFWHLEGQLQGAEP